MRTKQPEAKKPYIKAEAIALIYGDGFRFYIQGYMDPMILNLIATQNFVSLRHALRAIHARTFIYFI
ncbi:hypothetical protein [Pontibacter russatus]|uniref:hypothetical protein n=1 Tax=Pontibacter russatus TaxID=2694929 RepID=UPI001379DA44|nr:hypothetical protein [Pontibacter russatus]